LQEAVNNAVKHASCTVIKCKKGSNGKKIIFLVEDNGKGMNALDTATVTGNGIENMRHRANESSFELKIISTTGQGSLVTLSI
jgi:signal transduction histidine kinase